MKAFLKFSVLLMAPLFWEVESFSQTSQKIERSHVKIQDFSKSDSILDNRFKIQILHDNFVSYEENVASLIPEKNMSKVGFAFDRISEDQNKEVDVQYFFSAQEDEHYLNLKELFIKKKYSNSEIIYGRQLHNWSRSDIHWQQGIWQPRFMWSRLRPEQNGLLGIHYNKIQKDMSFRLLYSPIFIPEMGPRFKFNSNQFQSKNPWFNAPAKKASVEGLFQEKKIIYNLNTPGADEVIFHNTIAMQATWKKEDYFCQLSYAYKPMNGIYSSVDLLLRIDLPDSPPGVDVYPFVEHHRIVSGECGADKSQGWYGYISLNNENPLNKKMPEKYITKRFNETTVASSHLGYKLGKNDFSFSLMNLWGGDSLDSGEKASKSESFYESWYDYQQALKVAYNTKRVVWKLPTHLIFDLTWDFHQQGWSWTSEVNFYLQQKMDLFFRWDGIALAKGADSIGKQEFLDTFKRNDQASVGVNFEF